MVNEKSKYTIDKFIVLLFFLSITSTLYFSSLGQSNGQNSMAASIYVLLWPFGVAMLQLLRVFMLIGQRRTDSLSQTWIYIFIYYMLAFVLGTMSNHLELNYNTAWFIVCPPITWWYFSAVIKVYPQMKDTLVILGFWFLLVFSFISLYFIPRSLRDSGLFASLNTGYYVLFIYPLAMLNSNRLKRIISTVLMLIVIFLSMKRGGYVVIAIAFTSYLLFASKLSLFKKVIIVAASVGLLAIIIPKIDEYTYGTLSTRFEFSQNGGDEEGRSAMYPRVWKAFNDSDFLAQIFGHGLNAVSIDRITEGDAAHNDYLEFLYDFGIIGLCLLLSYQWQLFLITLRSKRDKSYFLPTIFAFTTIVVLSMVSIVYAFYYFLPIIPFCRSILSHQLCCSLITMRHSYRILL